MSEKKKYYWLKLQKDFFKRHDIRIIESQDNGKDYILFYLKLLVESIDHDGNLRFSESIPYNEKMLATITSTNVDIVRSAVKIFTELELMETMDDETIYMNDIKKMTGSESQWAVKKRIYREQQKALEDKREDNVLNMSNNVLNMSARCTKDVRTFSDKSKSIESSSKEEDYNTVTKEKGFTPPPPRIPDKPFPVFEPDLDESFLPEAKDSITDSEAKEFKALWN